jgi:hypothetical protein
MKKIITILTACLLFANSAWAAGFVPFHSSGKTYTGGSNIVIAGLVINLDPALDANLPRLDGANVFTGVNTFSNALYYTGTDNSGNQVATKDWTRSLLSIGNPIYHVTNQISTLGFEPTNFTYLGYSTALVETNALKIPITTAGQYCIAMVSTQLFTAGSILQGPANVVVYASRITGGAQNSLMFSPEIYYCYTSNPSVMLGDWTAAPQSITALSTNRYAWTIAFPNTTLLSNAYVVARMKVYSVNNVTQATFVCGQTFPSLIEFRTPDTTTLGTRGATNLVYSACPAVTNASYDTTTREITLAGPAMGWRTLVDTKLTDLAVSIDVPIPAGVSAMQVMWHGGFTNASGTDFYSTLTAGGTVHNTGWGMKIYANGGSDYISSTNGAGFYAGVIGSEPVKSHGNMLFLGMDTGDISGEMRASYRGTAAGQQFFGVFNKLLGSVPTNLTFTAPSASSFTNGFRLKVLVH